jgi:hypothetical protein
VNLGVSRNRFCDFLADPDSRSFSRFYTNIERSRYRQLGGGGLDPAADGVRILRRRFVAAGGDAVDEAQALWVLAAHGGTRLRICASAARAHNTDT